MRKRLIVPFLAIGLALSGGAIAMAQSAPEPPADAPALGRQGPKSHAGPHAPNHGRGHGPKFAPGVGHAIHGEVIVPVRPAEGTPEDAEPTFETVEFDRGKVVTATDDELTLERPDGVKVTVTISDATRFKGASKGSELTIGSPVFVVAKDGTARHIGQPRDQRPPRPQPAV